MDKLNPAPGANETVDSLFAGRLSVIQSRTGYRFSLDALLLAHFAAVGRAGRLIDLSPRSTRGSRLPGWRSSRKWPAGPRGAPR